jgi:hypothetical protein
VAPPVILDTQRQRQEDHEFDVSLGKLSETLILKTIFFKKSRGEGRMIEGIAQVVENAQGPGFKSKYQKKKTQLWGGSVGGSFLRPGLMEALPSEVILVRTASPHR